MTDLAHRIQSLIADRQQHASAISAIDQILERVGAALSKMTGRRNVRKVRVVEAPGVCPAQASRWPAAIKISGMILSMSTVTMPIEKLILDQLARGEMRLLSLVVAIRRTQGRFEGMKGDLSATVKSGLRHLINRNVVADVDGVYLLSRSN